MEGKKSFVLYTDLIHSVNLLTDKEAGTLFKHILNYVNDLSPELHDRLLQATFEPIKQNLKRDLEKYLKRVETAKANGKLGGRKPNKPTPVKDKPKITHSVISEPNKADNVNVNVNDSVNDSVNDNVIKLPFESERFFKAWELWKQFKKEQFKFTFKSQLTESTALIKLYNLSNQREESALEIIEQSVANGWKGFFALPKEKNKGSQPSTDYMENLKNRLNG